MNFDIVKNAQKSRIWQWASGHIRSGRRNVCNSNNSNNIFIQDCRKVKKLLIKGYVPAKREGKRQNKKSVVLRTHMSRLLKFQVLSQLRLEFRKSVYRM